LTSLRLVNPSKDLEPSYRSLIEELESLGEKRVPFPLSFPHQNFAELIARLEDNSNGRGLPDGFVAHSTYWLVAESEILGVSNLRHSLTPTLRREGGNIGYGVRPRARGHGYGVERCAVRCKKRKNGVSESPCNLRQESRVRESHSGQWRHIESEEFAAERTQCVVQRY
jgi:predicted acetyltransferase